MSDTKQKPPTAPKAAAPAPSAPATNKYVVAEGHNIFVSKNEKFYEGDVVELTPKLAKHFIKSKALEPFVPDDEADEGDD